MFNYLPNFALTHGAVVEAAEQLGKTVKYIAKSKSAEPTQVHEQMGHPVRNNQVDDRAVSSFMHIFCHARKC